MVIYKDVNATDIDWSLRKSMCAANTGEQFARDRTETVETL